MAVWTAPAATHAAPIIVGPTDVADGSLHLIPAVQAVGGTEAVWVLTNGGDRPATFALSLHDVVVGVDGRAAVGPIASAAPPADEVVLAPREQARVAVTLATTGTAVALRAATAGAPPLHAFAVTPGSGDLDADVVVDTADGRADVSLSTDTPTVANLSIAVAGWPGRDLGTATIGPVLVVPPGVTLAADIEGAVGPTTIEVAATTVGGATTTAHVSAFVVTRTALATVAAIVLALAVMYLVVVLRRRARGAHAPPGQP